MISLKYMKVWFVRTCYKLHLPIYAVIKTLIELSFCDATLLDINSYLVSLEKHHHGLIIKEPWKTRVFLVTTDYYAAKS